MEQTTPSEANSRSTNQEIPWFREVLRFITIFTKAPNQSHSGPAQSSKHLHHHISLKPILNL
jgi:hypothetical protein